MDNTSLQFLKQRLKSIPQQDYPDHSRVHLLRSFHFPHTTCYVKREDELGFGISGSKIRKYRALIPFLLHHDFKEVVVIGSAYSNHVLSFVQLLIENKLRPTLFLRGDPQRPLQGNALLLSLFISHSSVHWFSKKSWKNVEEQAYTYAKKQKHETFVVPEGGFCQEALPGALTLVMDLLENQKNADIIFDHIFIEAGTGFTASTLILGLSWLKHPAQVHVILLADTEEKFLLRLKDCHAMFMQWMGIPSPFPENFILHLPKLTGKFGQMNSLLFKTIPELASQEGFLTDPIYSAKLFIESKHLLSLNKIKGNLLLHHSGGALTLMGFQHQLQNKIDLHPT